ncbi:MAG: glycosyltransferase family 39 protein, partial [Anaerolineae bacterium]|nr:glycosyltransferase family 39 protein [Anaerolineae bacterium]
MHAERLSSSPLRWLLPAFVILAALYAWATPIFEASDELWHFGLVAHLAETGQLPIQDPDVITPWRQEGSQPPLYYALAAVIVRPFDLSDLDDQRQPNPHAKAGVPLAADNKNLVLHATPHPPLAGTVAAVFAVRAFSILLGAVTVAAVYASARVLLPARPAVALLAAGLAAFNPMFLFITASVNNDNLVTALNSVIIWQALLMIRDGRQTPCGGRLTFRRSLLVSVLLALAALSKLSGLVLIPAVALAGLWVAWRGRDWRGLLALAALMIAAWGLLAGWWYWRNLQLYGELFGTARMVAVAGARLEPFTPGALLAEFQGFRISFWGLFGGVNVLAPEAFYILMDAVTILALAGLGRYIWRRWADWPAL